jgi:hypothetical protein
MSFLNFDSPDLESRGLKKSLKVIVGIGVVTGALAIGSTLAANINLNSGAPVEFGQGFVATTACDDEITITPFSTFVNQVGEGSHLLSSIKISGIDSSSNKCSGKTFMIKAYGDSGLLDLFNYTDNSIPVDTDYESIEVINSGGVFSWVGGGTDGDDVINDENVGDPARDITQTSFTVSLTSGSTTITRTPMAIAQEVKRITVETYDGDLLNNRILTASQIGGYVESEILSVGAYPTNALQTGNFDGTCIEPNCFGYFTVNDWIANLTDEDVSNLNTDLGTSGMTRSQIADSMTFRFFYNASAEWDSRWNLEFLYLGEPYGLFGAPFTSIEGFISGFDGSSGFFVPGDIGEGLLFFSVDGRLQNNPSIGSFIPYGDQPNRNVLIRNMAEIWTLSDVLYEE